ncbi:GNAT family N-acetyltransferase [Bdellovibrio bacteriovorus]|uniref:GNAT family N-acetyltransferase n=1 Tax=Bdellovibrio bacteriovorus TaxID=959 RepID=A0A1Z3N4F0_BDEBC|nr:GNAT family N-acetyltransferase [Bdellovibrio bacteriovorus]ASD62348.1 GNAT family N-acetyltransferase [Bdellovibrio bacteriovorus]
MHIEFTQADHSHIEDLVELVNSAYRGDSSKQGWTTEADLLDGQRVDAEGIQALIDKEESVILVAEDDDNGDLLGCVHVEKQGSKMYLGMLTVAPELQSKGLGKLLLNESEALAQFWDCTTIFMTVISVRTELIKWYEKHGFRNTKETKPFPYGDERFGIPKVEGLQFTVLEKKV